MTTPIVAVGRFRLTLEATGARLDILDRPQEPAWSNPAPTGPAPHALGRAAALAAARSFRKGSGIVFVAPDGMGKSTFMQMLAADPVLRDQFDAFVLVRAADQPWEDVLSQIYRALHSGAQPPALPVSKSWVTELAGRRLGLAIDDADAPFELERLMRALPIATLFATASKPIEGFASFPLAPLSASDSRWVFTTLAPLAPAERGALNTIVATSGGIPSRLHQLAALAAKRSPLELARTIPNAAAFEAALKDAFAKLDPRQRGLLDAIGIFGPGAVAGDDPGALRLAADGLVLPFEDSWRIAPELEARYEQYDELTFRGAINSCAATLPLAIASVDDPSRLNRIVKATVRAGEFDRFADVIVLGKAAGDALARCGAWREWRTVLDLVSAAAGRTGADAVQSWVMHQSGTRFACLGETSDAQSMLRVALSRRKAAHDIPGMRLTQHNLAAITERGPMRRFVAAGFATAAGLVLVSSLIWSQRNVTIFASEPPHPSAPAAVAHVNPPVEVAAIQSVQRAPSARRTATAHHASGNAKKVAALQASAAPASAAPASAAPKATESAGAKPAPRASAAQAHASPKARVVASVEHPANASASAARKAAHYTQPEILSFGATKTLLTAGGSSHLCFSVRDAQNVRLTATSGSTSRSIALPAAARSGKTFCMRIAPRAATRYSLYASSGPLQRFRVLAIDVFAAPQSAPAETTAP